MREIERIASLHEYLNEKGVVHFPSYEWFMAVNNRKRNYNGKTISMNIKRVEERIERYLSEMDELDAGDDEEGKDYLNGRITKLKEKLAEYVRRRG